MYSIYGVTCLQTYSYYAEHSRKDGKFLKTFVSVVELSRCILSHITTRLRSCGKRAPSGRCRGLILTHWDVRLLDSFHLALVAHVIYYYGVSNWGDFSVVIKTVW
jgi:hypothetical protein